VRTSRPARNRFEAEEAERILADRRQRVLHAIARMNGARGIPETLAQKRFFFSSLPGLGEVNKRETDVLTLHAADLRPGVTWFMPIKVLNPYVGAYYTHWFVGGEAPDQDGVGARAGFSLGRMISLGVTYDRAFDCTRDFDIWTPQISAGLSM
jgi:hypothetical protein